MTEHSNLFPDRPMRVRFDPVMKLLEYLERKHGPTLRVEIIDKAMRIYDELRPAMDRMMRHRGTAQIEAFGVIRRGEVTFALMVKRDEMVIVAIELGTPPFPDPDGAGGWGIFKVALGARERQIRAKLPVTQSTGMAARPTEPTIAPGPDGDPGYAAAASALSAAVIDALPAPAAAAANAFGRLPGALLALHGSAKERLINSMIEASSPSYITVGIFDEGSKNFILDNDFRKSINILNSNRDLIRIIFARIDREIPLAYVFCQKINIFLIINKEDQSKIFENITNFMHTEKNYFRNFSLCCDSDVLKVLACDLSNLSNCETRYTENIEFENGAPKVTAWLVHLREINLQEDANFEADHSFVSGVRARFRHCAIAMVRHTLNAKAEAGLE